MSFQQLHDFPDRLSPMLVKELRQGLRTRGFVILFLAMQFILTLALFSAMGSNSTGQAGQNASTGILVISGITLLFIQPMRGQTAISSEIKGLTMETLSLTRLTAWRMVFGKWIALVSQSALMLITIIPYLILRYFLGGMNLVNELVILFLIFITSMAFCALSVGFSKGKIKLLSVVMPFFIFSGVTSGFGYFMSRAFGSSRSGFDLDSLFTLETKESFIAIGTYIGALTYFSWCALSHGASLIAPYAENHATRRRLIALGLVLVGILLAMCQFLTLDYLRITLAMIIFPAVFAALIEPAILLPSVAAPFVRRGVMGKMAGLFLYPGWPTGSMFVLLLCGIAFGSATFLPMFHTSFTYSSGFIGHIEFLALFGGVIFAAVVASFFSKDESKRFAIYFVSLLSAASLSLVFQIVTAITESPELLWSLCWNPFVFLWMQGNDYNEEMVTAVAVIVDALLALILIVRAMQKFRTYREAIRLAEMQP